MFRKPSSPPVKPIADISDAKERWSGLMACAQSGDQRAYQLLLEEMTPSLRSLCRSYLKSDDELEDVVQEILMTVHGIRHTYRCDRPFRPWLFTIARRRIVDWMRQRGRRKLHEAGSDGMAIEHALDMDGFGPDGAAMRADVARQVRHALARLPPHQREAVVLLRLRGLTLEEAADATNRSEGALKTACHRALKALHSKFQR